jgi:hypothetical protein
MFNKLAIQSLVASAVFGLALAFSAGPAVAGDPTCGGKGQPECPPPDECNPNKEKCVEICHNIGGPRDLGANCDMTGTCFVPAESGVTIVLNPGEFLGIIIGVDLSDTGNSPGLAHINHGDGPIVDTFDPPLHLASVIGPHIASNVECKGLRVVPQPDEPGN